MNASNVQGLSAKIASRKQKDIQLKIAYFTACLSLGLGVGLVINVRELKKMVVVLQSASQELHAL